MSSTKRTPDDPGRGSVATGQPAEPKDGTSGTGTAASGAAKGAGSSTAAKGAGSSTAAKGTGNGAAGKGRGGAPSSARPGPADGGAAESGTGVTGSDIVSTGSDTPATAGRPAGPVPGGAAADAGAPATPPSEAATAQFRVPAPAGAAGVSAGVSAPAAGDPAREPARGDAPGAVGAPVDPPAPDRAGTGAAGGAPPAADAVPPAPPAAAALTTPISTSALAASAAPPAAAAAPPPAAAPASPAVPPEAPAGSRGPAEPVAPTLDPVPAPAVPAPGPGAAHPPPWRRMSGPDGGRVDGGRADGGRGDGAASPLPDRFLDDGPTAFLEAPRYAPSGPNAPGSESAVTESGSWARVPRSRPPRQAALQLKRLDPWSVLKLALVLAVVLFFIWLVAIGVLYGVLDGMGVWDRLNGTYADLVSGESQTGDTLISAGRVFGLAAVVGAINSLLFAVAVTVGAFVYNVSADLVGGIEVTLSERD